MCAGELEKFVETLISPPWEFTLQQWNVVREDQPAEIDNLEVIRARPEEGWLEARIRIKVQTLDAVALHHLAMFMARLEQSFKHPFTVTGVSYDKIVTIYGRLQVPASKRAEFERVVSENRIILRADPSRMWIVDDMDENEILNIHVKSLTGKKETVTVRLSLPEGMFAALRTGYGIEEKFTGEKEFHVRLYDDVKVERLSFVVWHERKEPAEDELTVTVAETGCKITIPVRMGV